VVGGISIVKKVGNINSFVQYTYISKLANVLDDARFVSRLLPLFFF
jgi:hypothetical protein